MNNLEFWEPLDKTMQSPSGGEQVKCGNELCAMAWWPNCRCKCGGKNHGKKYQQLLKLGVKVTLPKNINTEIITCSQDHLGL